MEPYFRTKHNNDYAPFKRITTATGYDYDLRLEKDGVTANIIKTTVVSLDGTNDMQLVDSLMEELKRFGFK